MVLIELLVNGGAGYTHSIWRDRGNKWTSILDLLLSRDILLPFLPSFHICSSNCVLNNNSNRLFSVQNVVFTSGHVPKKNFKCTIKTEEIHIHT